jgi:hypothetical protein
MALRTATTLEAKTFFVAWALLDQQEQHNKAYKYQSNSMNK